MRELNLNSDQFGSLAADILKRGGIFRFKAQGSSMFPFIRSGDILSIKSIPIESLKTGDVLFCRLSERVLVAHRLVHQKIKDYPHLLRLRGDHSMAPGEIIRTNDIIGKVVGLKRGNLKESKTRGLRNWLTILWINSWPLGPAYLWVYKKIKRGLKWIMARIRMLRIFRTVRQNFFGKKP